MKGSENIVNAHAQSVENIFKNLNSSENGLTSSEAERRLHSYGFNELQTKEKVHYLKIMLRQFSSPLVLILIAALAISLFLGESADAIVIGIIIVINALLGFFQEERAEKALQALQKMTAPKATVLRDGKETIIDSKYLVPGDIILLKSGDKTPADARLLEVHDLAVAEASLTGESQAERKTAAVVAEHTALADRKNMIYASTIVTDGRGKAVVIATGMRTEVGKIAHLIKEAHEKMTPLQKKLQDLGKYLSIAVVLVAAIIFVTGIISGVEVSVMFLTAFALAVSAIPE